MLAKGLVCFQVTWMVVQVQHNVPFTWQTLEGFNQLYQQAIARKASGYPLALLELHTLVHVLCALIMYSLWIKVDLTFICARGLLTQPVRAETPGHQRPDSSDRSIRQRYSGAHGYVEHYRRLAN